MQSIDLGPRSRKEGRNPPKGYSPRGQVSPKRKLVKSIAAGLITITSSANAWQEAGVTESPTSGYPGYDKTTIATGTELGFSISGGDLPRRPAQSIPGWYEEPGFDGENSDLTGSRPSHFEPRITHQETGERNRIGGYRFRELSQAQEGPGLKERETKMYFGPPENRREYRFRRPGVNEADFGSPRYQGANGSPYRFRPTDKQRLPILRSNGHAGHSPLTKNRPEPVPMALEEPGSRSVPWATPYMEGYGPYYPLDDFDPRLGYGGLGLY